MQILSAAFQQAPLHIHIYSCQLQREPAPRGQNQFRECWFLIGRSVCSPAMEWTSGPEGRTTFPAPAGRQHTRGKEKKETKEREETAGVLDFQIRSGSKILCFDTEPQEANRCCILSLICEILLFTCSYFRFWLFIVDIFALLWKN